MIFLKTLLSKLSQDKVSKSSKKLLVKGDWRKKILLDVGFFALLSPSLLRLNIWLIAGIKTMPHPSTIFTETCAQRTNRQTEARGRSDAFHWLCFQVQALQFTKISAEFNKIFIHTAKSIKMLKHDNKISENCLSFTAWKTIVSLFWSQWAFLRYRIKDS